MKIVLNWGLGLQSTLLGVLACKGRLPRPDLIITADTQWERQVTIDTQSFYTDYFRKHGLDVVTVTAGNVRERGAQEHVHIPFWTDSGAPLQRQCTYAFKIAPIRRFVREWLGFPASKPPHPPPNSVVQWFGFTIDERYRMNASGIKYMKNAFPLIDMNIARWDCGPIFEDYGLPVPEKSACIGCPFRTATEWLDMRDNAPSEFDEAVKFDEVNRTNPLVYSTSQTIYIYKDAIPLADANLEDAAGREKKDKVAQLGLLVGCDSGYCHL